MTFFKRVFSSDYRRALAAEAAGDYTAAARAYALAGERAKVAEMHLYMAERTTAWDARLAELRAGVRWADEHTDDGRAVRRRIARALLHHVQKTGVISDTDRGVLGEAAALFESAGDPGGAGECHELAGDETAAADSYQRAGEVERLEAVLAREETRRKRHQGHREAFEEYELHLAAGTRDLARAALQRAIDLSLADAVDRGAAAGAADAGLRAGQYRTLLDSFDGKLLHDARVTLRVGSETLTCIGAFPLALGREPSCQVPLRDPGISRRHVEIVEAGGRFRVRDAGSRNGTTLGGMRIAGELPLEGQGDLGLGDYCAIRFRSDGGVLHLEVTRGIDRGLRIVASAGPLTLGGGAALLRFPGGRPTLSAAGERHLTLNGANPGREVQLLRGDKLSVDGDGEHVAIEVE